MQYCCNISTENVSTYVLAIHFTWTGWKDMQKKKKRRRSSTQKNKNELHFIQKTRFGFKSHNGVLCLHTEVTNWAPYSSHMHQMKLRYTGYIYRNTRTSCSIHKRSHITIFFLVVSYSAEDQIFTTENFPWNTFCFVHSKKRTHNLGLESL